MEVQWQRSLLPEFKELYHVKFNLKENLLILWLSSSHVVYFDTEQHRGWEQHKNIVSTLLLELSVFKIFYF